MSEKPDFAALRAKRDSELSRVIDEIAAKHFPNTPRSKLVTFDLPRGCYCACPDGPCEHEFTDWREFEDGRGGEQVCKLCGLGAMSHSLRCSD